MQRSRKFFILGVLIIAVVFCLAFLVLDSMQKRPPYQLSDHAEPQKLFVDSVVTETVETTVDALTIWRDFSDVKPALVVFSNKPLMPVPPQVRNEVSELLAVAGKEEVRLQTARPSVPETLLRPEMAVTAGLHEGFFSRVVWVVSLAPGSELQLETFVQKLQSRVEMRGEDLSSFHLEEGRIVGTLADNGGETLTHLPTIGSPALNAGNNASAAALSADQRGDVRLLEGTVEIGAVETDTPGTGNNAPTFTSYSFGAIKIQAVDIRDAKLLAKASDLDGDTLTISGFSATSAQGGSVLYPGGTLSYIPANDVTGPDSFTITISDGNGGTVVGTINVTISEAPSGESGNGVSMTVQPGSGDVDLVFLGIPGVSYDIQRSFDLIIWTTISTGPAAANGAITYTDPAPGGAAFYRTVANIKEEFLTIAELYKEACRRLRRQFRGASNFLPGREGSG